MAYGKVHPPLHRNVAYRGSVLTFLSVVCCLYVTFLLPQEPHTIGQTWSGPIKSWPSLLIKFLDGIYLKDEKVKKQKIPDVSPEKFKGQKVSGVSLKSDETQKAMQTEDKNIEKFKQFFSTVKVNIICLQSVRKGRNIKERRKRSSYVDFSN